MQVRDLIRELCEQYEPLAVVDVIIYGQSFQIVDIQGAVVTSDHPHGFVDLIIGDNDRCIR